MRLALPEPLQDQVVTGPSVSIAAHICLCAAPTPPDAGSSSVAELAENGTFPPPPPPMLLCMVFAGAFEIVRHSLAALPASRLYHPHFRPQHCVPLLPEVVLAAAADASVDAVPAGADVGADANTAAPQRRGCKCALNIGSTRSDSTVQLLAIPGLPEGRHSISVWVQSATSGRALTPPVQRAFYAAGYEEAAAGSETASRDDPSHLEL
jgi:hypothetical protein